ncbi:MAG: isoprenylcysteine carboxylmethyltransferase family protein [Candidatus Thermoplasmatota archaeon]
MDPFWRALARTGPVVALGIVLVFGASALLTRLVGFPLAVQVPLGIRVAGFLVMASGVVLLGWLFRHRSYRDIVISTDVTLLRVVGRAPAMAPAGPLIVSGPHSVVRHPMYTGIIVAVLGLGVAMGAVWVMLASLGFLAWYRLLVIPLEDRDLVRTYGDAYREYMRETPALVPLPRWRRAKR